MRLHDLDLDLRLLFEDAALAKAASSRASRNWGSTDEDEDQAQLVALLVRALKRRNPIDRVYRALETSGVLDALDDTPEVTFRHLRRTAIPPDDIYLLRKAGYTDDEIEVLLVSALEMAHRFNPDLQLEKPSSTLHHAQRTFDGALESLSEAGSQTSLKEDPPRKKRKILNGIGGLLGGAILGVGNVLIGAGMIAAPNPAIAAGVIASGGLAVSQVLKAVGDLRGE